MQIRPFAWSDEAAVVDVWRDCGLLRPWNDPNKDIARKMAEQPELFLVGEVDGKVVATAMVGYEGHRGLIYYMAVLPDFQKLSYGKSLLLEAERLLLARGCPKVVLMVRTTNTHVIGFYRQLGFEVDDVVAMGKRLDTDLTS